MFPLFPKIHLAVVVWEICSVYKNIGNIENLSFSIFKTPPGVAPWLYRSHEAEQFDDIVLYPIAEE